MARKPAPPKPTPAELDLLRVLWPLGAATAKQVHEVAQRERPELAYATVLRQRDRLPPGFNEFEVGTGQAIELRTFVEMAAAALASRSALRFGALPHRAGEIMRSSADARALESLGWRASTPLQAGIRRTVEAAA